MYDDEEIDPEMIAAMAGGYALEGAPLPALPDDQSYIAEPPPPQWLMPHLRNEPFSAPAPGASLPLPPPAPVTGAMPGSIDPLSQMLMAKSVRPHAPGELPGGGAPGPYPPTQPPAPSMPGLPQGPTPTPGPVPPPAPQMAGAEDPMIQMMARRRALPPGGLG